MCRVCSAARQAGKFGFRAKDRARASGRGVQPTTKTSNEGHWDIQRWITLTRESVATSTSSSTSRNRVPMLFPSSGRRATAIRFSAAAEEAPSSDTFIRECRSPCNAMTMLARVVLPECGGPLSETMRFPSENQLPISDNSSKCSNRTGSEERSSANCIVRNLYPTPNSVIRCSGRSGNASSFLRIRAMVTSRTRLFPPLLPQTA